MHIQLDIGIRDAAQVEGAGLSWVTNDYCPAFTKHIYPKDDCVLMKIERVS